MTLFILPILVLDFLLLLWIIGHMPRHLQFPELTAPVLLIVPFIFGVVVYQDLKRSFGMFDTSVIPLLGHVELYFLFSLVYLGFFASIGLALRYHESLPRNSIYYQGITNNYKQRIWLPVLLYILLIVISILCILRFYFDYEMYR